MNGESSARSRRAALLAWSISGLIVAVVATTIALVYLNRASIHDLDQGSAIYIVLPIGFTFVGGLVASRLPSNPLGWVFLAISLANAIPGAAIQFTLFHFATQPGAPFSPWIPWFGSLIDSLVYPAGLAPLALLLIPNGRFLSPRWRLVAWAGALLTFFFVVTTMTDPSLILGQGSVHVANPTGVAAMATISRGLVGNGLFLVGLGFLALAGASVVMRLRRATGDERLQLRWVAYAVAFSVLAEVPATIIGIIFLTPAAASVVTTIVAIAGFGVAMPASFGVAMLRYRLYDLDLLLNRTVVYGAVAVVLLAVFGVAEIVAQRAVESLFHQRSELVTAAIGLGAGIAFAPMRRTVRPIVDRVLPARARLTLLFTDIVGSTQAIVDLGDERWRELLDRYRVAVRRELTRFRGREVNTAGDAFFATFDRPTAAVQCARAIGAAVNALGLKVRTGLHVGDVEMRGEQVSGLAVHAAARVMAEAGEDQILVSSDLAEILGGGVPLRDAGRHALKGVPGEWQLFAVHSPG
jgi:class 3 adenylate cyclase